MKGDNHIRGQSIIEFALVLPLLIIIAVGVLDLGRIFFGLITVSNASREGARFLTFTPQDYSNPSGQFYDTKIVAVNEATGSFISLSTANVVASCSSYYVVDPSTGASWCASGSTATVTVSHNIDLIAGWVLPSPVTLTRSTSMVVP